MSVFSLFATGTVYFFLGIKKVVFFSDKHKNKESMIASRRLLDLARVQCEQHIPKHKKITIDFDYINRRYQGRAEE